MIARCDLGGVHGDGRGRWFAPPLVTASLALLSAPIWVAIAMWRSLHDGKAAEGRRS